MKKTKTDTKLDVLQQALNLARERFEESQARAQEAAKAHERAKASVEACRAELTKAQEAADDQMPCCTMVTRGWRTGGVKDPGYRVVILRVTPSGILVVRHHGALPPFTEYRFKWDSHNGVYRQAEKSAMLGDTRVLQDVPKAYVPKS